MPFAFPSESAFAFAGILINDDSVLSFGHEPLQGVRENSCERMFSQAFPKSTGVIRTGERSVIPKRWFEGLQAVLPRLAMLFSLKSTSGL